MYLGWDVQGETIKWANEVLKKFPNRQAIIATHLLTLRQVVHMVGTDRRFGLTLSLQIIMCLWYFAATIMELLIM